MEVRVIYNNNRYRCELWGGSTKHPDVTCHFEDYEKSDVVVDDNYNIFQWLLEIASRMTFPFHAKRIAEYALSIYGKEIDEFVIKEN